MLIDITGAERIFHYRVPDELDPVVRIGSIVRVPLQSRRVRGWVLDDVLDDGRELRELAAVVSLGPSAEVVSLAKFGAWRYVGRLRPLLVAGSPERIVSRLAESPRTKPPALEPNSMLPLVREALVGEPRLLRVAPGASRLDVVVAAMQVAGSSHDLLVLVPERRDVDLLALRLRRLGFPVACYPEQWALAAGGGTVVIGTRSAAFASMPALGGIVVLDAHAQSYIDQRAPTWNATVICAERAKRTGVGCLFVSPCPSLELEELAQLVATSRATERADWPAVEVLDRRDDDPRSGLYSEQLATIIKSARDADPRHPVVCILNRVGRALLLACGSCGELARCEKCNSSLAEQNELGDDGARVLVCRQCSFSRPYICASCASMRLKRLRVGVSRVVEELRALTGLAVAEVTGASEAGIDLDVDVLVGTEAVLHRISAAPIVVFLDIDQELLAPRFRATEQAFALIGLAARRVAASRPAAGSYTPRLVFQTRLPKSEAILAAMNGDPEIVSRAERARRLELRLPPYRALARVSGNEADEVANGARSDQTLEVAEVGASTWLVRAHDNTVLADRLALYTSDHDVRVEVDPVHV